MVRKEAGQTLLGNAINFPFDAVVRGLKVRDLGPTFRGPLKTDVPTLFISGTFDGRTPVANAQDLLPGFRRATHLILVGAGHSNPLFLSSPEIEVLMKRFLHGEVLPKEIRIEVPMPAFFGLPAP